jgi:TP901 family phage tail tape measure protein
MNKAAGYGFSASDVSKVSSDMATGATDVKFTQRDASGYVKQVTATVNNLGEVSTKVNRRFQSLADGVMRNTLEFVKWSLAIALVMGPLQKMGELAQAAVEQQDKLVNITIAMGNAQKTSNQIYTEAYGVSKKVSEEVGNVLDAYTLAYRATGGMADETVRFTTATKLLSDALTLSKLSGMDEATAIDTLTASLKQTGMGLTEGTTLLDKFVRATKIANVDLESLATSFAVAGDVSAKAGLDVDGLIGLVATLGETGIASGAELANMSKAVVSGFQSDTGTKALEAYGISLTDVTGKVRDFSDVMNQLATMSNEDNGSLSKSQYSDITLALGGGVRRQAVWSTLIQNWSRVEEVSKGVTNAEGDAAKAMAMKYDTVTSASTRYANSMSNLAMTLGNKGGLLDTFSSLLNLLTGVTDALEKVSSVTGRITPTLALLGAIGAVGAIRGDAFKANAYGKMSSGTASVLSSAARLFVGNKTQTIAGTGEQVLSRDVFGGNAAKQLLMPRNFLGGSSSIMGAMGGIAIAGLTAAGNANDSSATKTQRDARVAADIIGGAGGMIVAALTGGNVLVGSAIGTAISEAFVNATVARDKDFQKLFEEVIPKGSGKTPTNAVEETTSEKLDKVVQEIYKSAGNGSGLVGSSQAAFQSWWIKNIGGNLFGKTGPAIGISKQLGYTPDSMTPEQWAMTMANPEQKARLLAIQKEANPEDYNATQTATMQKQVWEANKTLITSLQEGIQKALLTKLVTGDITSSEYRRSYANTERFNVNLTSAYGSVGSQYGKATGKDSAKVMEDFANVLTYASDEQTKSVFEFINSITELKGKLSNTSLAEVERAKIAQQINDAETATVTLLGQLNQGLAGQIKLMAINNFDNVTSDQVKGVYDAARQEQLNDFLAAGGAMDKFADYIKSLAEWVPQTATGYLPKTNIPAPYIQEQLDKGIAAGTIPEVNKTKGWTTMDATPSQFEKALALYDAKRAELMKLGVTSKEEEQVVILSDGTMKSMSKDWKIMEYLLAQILDTEQKQLETSLYNFPAGMTAFVPWDAVNRTLSQGGGTSTKGLEDVTSPSVDLEQPLPTEPGTGYATTPVVDTQKLIDEAIAKAPSTIAAAEASLGKSSMGGVADLHLGKRSMYGDGKTGYTPTADLGKVDFGSMFRNAFGNVLDPLKSSLGNVFGSLEKTFRDMFSGTGAFATGGSKTKAGISIDDSKISSRMALGGDNTAAGGVAKVTVDFKSTVYVQLDGRTLGTAMSKYLGDKVAKMTNAGSSAMRSNII